MSKRRSKSVPAVVVHFPNATKFKRIAFVGPESVRIANKIVAEANRKKK